MKVFTTNRSASFSTQWFRLIFNYFPAYRRGGGRVLFISSDWQEIHIKLSLNWATRNYVGSIFGGSIYAAIDPVYMLQLLKILGDDYIVWDKAATIKFIKPIKCNVYAKFELSDSTISDIKSNVIRSGKYVIELPVTFVDKNDIVYARSEKVLYIADKEYYKNR